MRRIHLLVFAATIAATSCNNETSKPAENNADSSKVKKGITEENISIKVDSENLNSYLVYNDSTEGKKPAVLVIPEWWGLNDYSKGRAKQLAELGYVALAVDMYGDGKQAANPDEAGKLAGPFYGNAQLGESRIEAAIAKLKSMPNVDATKIAAIGYCFGGSMVLNAAKMDPELAGVVSFHGILVPTPPDKSKTKAQILICHGGADQFTPAKDSAEFRKQLDSIGAAYEFKTYPNSKHAFTNPMADDYNKKFNMTGVAYNPEADKQSWEDMKAFLSRVFK